MPLPLVSKEKLIWCGLRGMKLTPALAIVFAYEPRQLVSKFLRTAPRIVPGFRVPRAARIVRRRRPK